MSDSRNSLFAFERPGLLVSVRNAAEAGIALSSGADVIDVKEPSNGSLGAAASSTIREIASMVGGRAGVTAAMGELAELELAHAEGRIEPIAAGVALFKIGLSGCRERKDWSSSWGAIVHEISRRSPSATAPVAVVYADWEAAGSPEPLDVFNAGVQIGCPALLIDTWSKTRGSLFDHWREDRLAKFVSDVRAKSLAIVLAGSLDGESFTRAAAMLPDLLAVRGAACDAGRDGVVSAARIAALKRQIANFRIRTHKNR